MNYWFTSDYHLGHWNICRYVGRPFKSLEEMNSTIIYNHNQRVKPDDTVFMIGDFCFRNSLGGKKGEGDIIRAIDYEKQLNGKLIFIQGNHDKNNSCKTNIHNIVIYFGSKWINLVHNPTHASVNYEINLTGHVHNRWQCKRIKKGFGFTDCINVGVDVFGFKPISWQDIMKRYHQWKKENNYV